MALNIQKMLTPYNFSNKDDVSRIKYIVIHYFGSLSSAYSVAKFFQDAYRGASAHYIVDDTEVIYQCVEDGDIAWHCGTSGKYFHPECRNSNSIGIEVRPYKRNKASLGANDQDWFFTDKTIEHLLELTKFLMNKYNIPVDNVLRHYDVTHKCCPNPFVVNDAACAAWISFKSKLIIPTEVPGFKVRVTASALNIRSGPGMQYPIKGTITDKGVYSIVETKEGWGKLKSGVGWIALNYTITL